MNASVIGTTGGIGGLARSGSAGDTQGMDRQGATTSLVVGALIATSANTYKAFADPSGPTWDLVAIGASTAFSLTLVVWIFVYVRERRAKRF